jgi:hypothetical protein
MSKSFTHYFKDFTFARAIETEQDTLKKNREYQKLNWRLEILQHDLFANLPPEGQELATRYFEAQAQQQNFLIATLYRRGLKDGLRLAILLLKTGVLD